MRNSPFFLIRSNPLPPRLSPLNPHSQPRAHSARRAVWRLKGAARYLIWEMHTWKRNIAKRRKKLRNIKCLQIAYNSMRRIETELGRSNAFERKVKIKHNLEDFFRKLFKGENFSGQPRGSAGGCGMPGKPQPPRNAPE